MSDPPVTPRPGPGLPATTLPLAAPPPPAAQAHARATQMSAAVVPTTLESPAAAPRGPAGPCEVPAASNAAEEISGVAVALTPALNEPTMRNDSQDQAAPVGPSRRIGPATLASPLVPPVDESSSPRPPVPAVIDVGAPAHAFVARSAHAPPPMMPYGSAHPHGGHAHAHGQQFVGARSSANRTLIVLAIVAAAVLLLGVGIVIVAVGFVAASRSGSEPSARDLPGAAAAPPDDTAGDPSSPRRYAPPPEKRPRRR